MKQTGLIIFLTIALTLYTLLNFYIIRRGWLALHASGHWRLIFLVSIVACAAAYPLSRFLEHSALRMLANPVLYVGAYYLAFMALMFCFILLVDDIRLADWVVGFLPTGWRSWKGPVAARVYLGLGLLAMVLVIIGGINARMLHVKNLHLTLPKKQGSLTSMRVALISDVHIGALMPPRRFESMVEKINEQNPDMVLIVGDLFDEDVTRLNQQELKRVLSGMKSRYGVYAVLGNHEYFTNVNSCIALMEQSGITVLRDRCLAVADAVYLLGRDDLQGRHWVGRRAGLQSLAPTDGRLPLIVMDHQPHHLQESREAGADLQVSGHTHHGQFWPFNYITRAVYDISWGYAQIGRTQYYVSCGAGTWGPPVRLANRPELLVLNLSFDPHADRMVQ